VLNELRQADRITKNAPLAVRESLHVMRSGDFKEGGASSSRSASLAGQGAERKISFKSIRVPHKRCIRNGYRPRQCIRVGEFWLYLVHVF